MINIFIVSDFAIQKSGIASTASSILKNSIFKDALIFSDLDISIAGFVIRPTSEIKSSQVDLVFTHTEYSKLPQLQRKYPNAVFHVGDWPILYWKSIFRLKPVKGILAILRCYLRLRKINSRIRFVFVTSEDCNAAINFGFFRSIHIPIGVNFPSTPFNSRIDFLSVCFSGNFRYEPNRDAALRLLDLVKYRLPQFKVILVGYYADDFSDKLSEYVELFPDVPSIPNFLSSRRPIYISLLNKGAGAKNKILEAMVAGCPIICTKESLDSSILPSPTIKVVEFEHQIFDYLSLWSIKNNTSLLEEETIKLAQNVRKMRSWNAVSKKLHDQLFLQ